ncbi:MAG: holo-ACP synthase [Thermacetogeniaceae bacterium]
MKGIGIDIVEIERIERALARHPALLQRIFSRDEIAYCQRKKYPFASFAARFAAKEAVRKACKCIPGRDAMPWCEIEVVSDGTAPKIRLSGKAAWVAEQKGIADFLISLSHCKKYACAVVVAIGWD